MAPVTPNPIEVKIPIWVLVLSNFSVRYRGISGFTIPKPSPRMNQSSIIKNSTLLCPCSEADSTDVDLVSRSSFPESRMAIIGSMDSPWTVVTIMNSVFHPRLSTTIPPSRGPATPATGSARTGNCRLRLYSPVQRGPLSRRFLSA